MKKSLFIKICCLLLSALLLAGCAGLSGENADIREEQKKLESILDGMTKAPDSDSLLDKLGIFMSAGDLIAWLKNTTLTPEQTVETVRSWLRQHPELSEGVTASLRSVADSITESMETTAGRIAEFISGDDLDTLGQKLVDLIKAAIES